HVLQQEDQLELVGEGGDRVGELLRELPPLQRAVGGGGPVALGKGGGGGGQLVEVLVLVELDLGALLPVAELHEGGVGGDPVDPGGEQALAPEGVELPEDG